jgi:hypothetical protein
VVVAAAVKLSRESVDLIVVEVMKEDEEDDVS